MKIIGKGIDMLENEKPIDVFYDMDISQICQHFSKSRNTVDKAVAKLVKDYPDKDWKYKNPETRRITIKAEGVEKLSNYFRKEKHEVSTVEMELRYENDKLISQETQYRFCVEKDTLLVAKLEKHQQTFLLEQKSKDETIEKLESENQMLKEENSSIESMKKEIEEYKKKEEEYNSKSFFYRLTHKF